jgi:hypothetical protein
MERYTVNDNIIKCPYICPECGTDLGKKQMDGFYFGGKISFANYLLEDKYTFTDEEMLE